MANFLKLLGALGIMLVCCAITLVPTALMVTGIIWLWSNM